MGSSLNTVALIEIRTSLVTKGSMAGVARTTVGIGELQGVCCDATNEGFVTHTLPCYVVAMPET